MKKIRFRNKYLRIIIYTILGLFLIYIYFLLLINTNFKDYLSYSISNNINNKFSYKTNKLVYNSLNRIVNINDNKKEEEIIIENKVVNPLIYIYNTHDSEKYNLPFTNDYSITPDVKIASFILKDHLNDLNIDSYVETKSVYKYIKKNNLNYNISYDISRKYITDLKNKYNFKIYIDLHRDSVKYNATLYTKNNKKYAKILFVLGKKNKNYKNNLKFINYINDKLNKDYKGLSRGILYRDDARFNQDISDNAILLELGGVDNTIEELNNTLYILANILKEYLNEN